MVSADRRGDILDEPALRDAMQGCELVFNVAGLNSLCPRDPGQMLRTNVQGVVDSAMSASSTPRSGADWPVMMASGRSSLRYSRASSSNRLAPSESRDDTVGLLKDLVVTPAWLKI